MHPLGWFVALYGQSLPVSLLCNKWHSAMPMASLSHGGPPNARGCSRSRRDWLTLAVPQRSKTVSIEKKNTAAPVTARSSLTTLAGYKRRLGELAGPGRKMALPETAEAFPSFAARNWSRRGDCRDEGDGLGEDGL